MAEGGDDRPREDLTEAASPYRLEEMRRKGMVAQSRELSGLAALLAAGITLYLTGPKMGADIAEFMQEVFRTDLSARLDLSNLSILNLSLMKALRLVAAIGLPVCAAGFVVGALASFTQVGSVFSLEPIQPDFSKVNPMKGLLRFFSMKQALDGVRLLVKISAVSLVSYFVIKGQVFNAPVHFLNDPAGQPASYAEAGRAIFFALLGVLLVFAVIDFGLQRWDYQKSARMTKQEAKQEHKEREGDPQIKARIRSVQREMARKRMMQAVKKADVIVTNPTHIAIAIVYDKTNMAAPKVVAKGADFLAQKIKQIAADAGVPMVENVPLARTLYKTVKVGQFVPRGLYQAVAEVLAYVYRLKGKKT